MPAALCVTSDFSPVALDGPILHAGGVEAADGSRARRKRTGAPPVECLANPEYLPLLRLAAERMFTFSTRRRERA
jgi:hypothetical protein